jgi:hypothetical protein
VYHSVTPTTIRTKDLLPGWRQAWFVCILLLALLTGCGRASRDLPDITVNLSIDPQPPQIGPAVISAALADAEGQAISGATVEFEGNMNHAGMVPVIAMATETSPGIYTANLEFTMGGDWFILVKADLPDGRSMEHQVDVPGVDLFCGETPSP